MTDLVTMEQARMHLRTDSDDDPWLELWIPAVSASVRAWLKDDWRCYVLEVGSAGHPVLDEAGVPALKLDDAGQPQVKGAVQIATLIELASQYRFREGEGVSVVPAAEGYGYALSQGATAILSTLRKSTVA